MAHRSAERVPRLFCFVCVWPWPHLDTGDLDHEHGGAQHVARMVAPELDAGHLLHLVEVDGLDLLHALLQVRLRVQHVVRRDVAGEAVYIYI